MKLSVTPYWEHVITVLGGSVAAQALPLLAAPLITRLCTPKDLGAFSVWLGVIAIASVVATLRLENAMILDHGPAEQQTCFSVTAYFATLLALVITIFSLIARAWGIPQSLNMSWFSLLTIGIGMWLTAYMHTILAYATSYRAFRSAALAKVWGAGAIVLVQLGLLFAGLGGQALMAGQIIGLAIGLMAAIHLLSPPRASIAIKPTDSQWKYLKKHQAFWRFALPANLLGAIGGQLPLFLIGSKHGVLAAGLFALTSRVMAAPASLLAASVLEVFKRESVHEFQALGNCRKAYLHTFKTLFLLGSGPTLFIFVFATDLFAWVFGEPWRAAGEFAQILAPLFFLNFIASPLSYVFNVAGKQKVNLIWQFTLLMMTIAVFSAPLTLKESLWGYTIGYSFLYIIYLFLSYRFSLNRLNTA